MDERLEKPYKIIPTNWTWTGLLQEGVERLMTLNEAVEI